MDVPKRYAILLCLLSLALVAPIAMPLLAETNDPHQLQNQMETQPPIRCIDTSGEPPSMAGEDPVLTGSLSMQDRDNATVRIEFDRVSNHSVGQGELQLQFGAFTNLSASSGFENTGSGRYNWERGRNAWIEYRTQNVSNEVFSVDLTTQDPNRTIIPLPDYGGRIPFAFRAADQGFVGSRFAYLGEYETASTTIGCQEIRMVVPEDTTLPAPPAEIVQTLAETARRVPVGHAYEEVRVFVSPTSIGTSEGFVRYRDFERDGGPEIVIEHDAPYNGPEEFAWRHEYIHTRQNFDVQSDLLWVREASANYLAYRTALDSGVITPREYDGVLAERRQARFSDRLATNATGQVAYQWGPIVLSRVNERLRSASNHTVVDTFGWLNTESTNHGDVSLATFDNRTRGGSPERIRSDDGFNLTAATYGTPPTPAYLLGPEWLPGAIRKLWLPANQYLLWLGYGLVALLWGGTLENVYGRAQAEDEQE